MIFKLKPYLKVCINKCAMIFIFHEAANLFF